MPHLPRRHPDRTTTKPARFARDSGDAAAPAADEPSPGEGVLAGYRLLRRLAAGDRADVYLAVADAGRARSGGEGEPAVAGSPLVVMRVYGVDADDDAITTEIEAMEADATGTLPRLLDVANVGDGRGCLVVERVPGRALSELLASGGLAPGQVVTALAPVVVVLRELGDRGFVHHRLAASDIRIDDSGRPRLLGLGALRRLDGLATAGDRVAAVRDGHAALLRLLEDVVAACADRAAFDPVLELLRSALAARPFRRVESDVERALFAVAPALPIPSPLDRVPAAATLVRVPSAPDPGVGAHHELRPGGAEPVSARDARLGRWAALAQLPPEAAEELAAALDSDPRARAVRRLSAWAAGRRPVLITGGLVGAAALVALLSAVPPSSAEDAAAVAPTESAVDGAARDDPGETGGASATSDGDGAPETEPGPSLAELPDDPVAAAAALLEIRHTCLVSGDAECLRSVDQPGSPIGARDRAAIEAGGSASPGQSDLGAITVAADLGDAVVLTVPWTEAGREPASLLMMRSEAGWRLREWFD